jgi:hypothetical protein
VVRIAVLQEAKIVTPPRGKLTRRQFAQKSGALAAGAVMATVTDSSAESQPTTGATTTASNRLDRIDATMDRQLSPEMRQRVTKEIAENDEAWRRGRRFPIPDSTDPAIVFHPQPRRR